ncbi:MAG: response regulator [Pseudomonadales bacterium]
MKKILLVDDEQHILRVMQTALSRYGYTVSTALNGAEGLQKYNAENPDAIIVDIDMPRMNGRELCSAILAEDPQPACKIFISTGCALRDLRAWAEQFEQIMFMEKPISIRNVADRLARHLGE